VRRFKVPAKANCTSILVEANYSQTLCTWVGHIAGEWNGWGWYNENECEMEVRNPGQESQRIDVNASDLSLLKADSLRFCYVTQVVCWVSRQHSVYDLNAFVYNDKKHKIKQVIMYILSVYFHLTFLSRIPFDCPGRVRRCVCGVCVCVCAIYYT